MSRTHSKLSREILSKVGSGILLTKLFQIFEVEHERKAIYDCLFRLASQGVIRYDKHKLDALITLTEDGQELMARVNPTRDGVWKIVIFDIPEKKRDVRNTLRSKLKILGFKKWQESIWISPYRLDRQIEEDFSELATKLFIRVIKTTNINYTKDLEELFK